MRALCLLFSSVLLFVAACGNANEGTGAAQSENEPPVVLDLKRGSFGGVGLGDTVPEMHRIFGEAAPAAEGEPVTALAIGNDQDYSPPVLAPGIQSPSVPIANYRYDQVVFMTSRSRIDAIIVNDPKARDPRAGVRIGDDLARARDHFRLRCGTANENTEYEPFPACVGRIAPEVYVWFGADPIRNITLSSTRPDGV